ncbi:hypothetical protein ACTWQB_01980 [Piscibacillus sp. B03]|uniref:hypothetical protein n=1 Tax=Piscibacillus sp. B03 TaxID=3457430 RepID=UPI003FCDD43D
MKTNIINGAFIYGWIPVDTAEIKLEDSNTDEGVKFSTGADGLYPVIAETDENGLIEHLVIDVSRFNELQENHKFKEVAEEDILENE